MNSNKTEVTFNADRDFPSYGFRLGFGFIEGPFTNSLGSQSYTLIEPDGSKRELVGGAAVDSSYLEFNPSTLTLRRKKDGTQWAYQQIGTSTLYRPIRISDTNGNFMTIAYIPQKEQHIGPIMDTLL